MSRLTPTEREAIATLEALYAELPTILLLLACLVIAVLAVLTIRSLFGVFGWGEDDE